MGVVTFLFGSGARPAHGTNDVSLLGRTTRSPSPAAIFDCLMRTYGFLTADFWRETKFVKAPFQDFTDLLAKPGLMLEAPVEKIEA